MFQWFLIALNLFSVVKGQTTTSNCEVLNSIFQSLGGTVTDTDCCNSIPGVTCFNGRVTKLTWANSALQGSLPANITLLTDLTELYICLVIVFSDVGL